MSVVNLEVSGKCNNTFYFLFSEGKEFIEKGKDITHLGLFLDRRAVYKLLEAEGKLGNQIKDICLSKPGSCSMGLKS